jgi:alkaline phosphatase
MGEMKMIANVPAPHGRRTSKLILAAIAAAVLALAVLLSTGGGTVQAAAPTGQSVIVLIGDGMGPAQRTLTQLTRYGLDQTQPMDSLDAAGSLNTLPFGKPGATDSAAGATAIATGEKTRNGYAGVGPDKQPLRTLLEIARDEGKSTGLVEDNDVTNATMAGFAAHIDNRDKKQKIAQQFLRRTKPDVILGGGAQIWCKKGQKPPVKVLSSDDKCRGRNDLISEAEGLGYEQVSDAESLAAASGPKILGLVRQDPLILSLISDYDPADDPNYVAEEDLVDKAIDTLSQNPNGFFLAIDVDEIDDGGHATAANLVAKGGQQLNRIVKVIEEYRATDPNLLVVVTADHETGGLTIEDPRDPKTRVQGEEIPKKWWHGPFKVKNADNKISTDWTTDEHTTVAVPITASGPMADEFIGTHDNTHVFDVARQVLTAP